MEPPTDRDLLRRFRESGEDAAFTELVTRHCSLVWATALRITGDPDLARDVTQTVFAVLARKASRLEDSVVVPGWLHRAARLEAAKQVRNDRRRVHRETAAMKELESDRPPAEMLPAAETVSLQPLLDEALDALGDADRQAVVLRFLSGRSFSEIGTALGVTDDAAQKRVSRALDRMRQWFLERGVPVREGATAACLGAAASVSAPPGLAAGVASAALGGAAGSLAPAGWILMNSKLVIASAAAIAVATVGWQQLRLGRLEKDNAALRRALADPAPAPVVQAAAAAALPSLSTEDRAELLRLRGEVALLREASRGAPAVAAAEARAREAVAAKEALQEEIRFRTHRIALINAGKTLGLMAATHAVEHQDRWPTSWDEMEAQLPAMGVSPEDAARQEMTPEAFEYLGAGSSREGDLSRQILFRERAARRIPSRSQAAAEMGPSLLFDMPLGDGWERSYVIGDGSVQTRSSPDGDFTRVEQEITGQTAAAGP